MGARCRCSCLRDEVFGKDREYSIARSPCSTSVGYTRAVAHEPAARRLDDLASSPSRRASPASCATCSSPRCSVPAPRLDAFNVAFRIPNLLRRLFAEGAFSQAFVPMLAAPAGGEGDEADAAADRRRGHGAGVGAGRDLRARHRRRAGLVWLMASGLERFDEAVVMTRVMFPYIGFMSLVALSAGILNTWKRFAVPAATPVLLNLAIIGAVWVLAPLVRARTASSRSTRWPAASWSAACCSWRCRCRRWRASACLPRIGVRAARPARRLEPSRRAPDPAADGAGAARRVGRPALAAHQHPDRLAPGRRRGVVAVLRRPADGVPDRAARRRTRRRADAAAVGGAGPRRRRRATPRCSTGACAWRSLLALPCARALLVFPEPLVATLFQRGAVRRRRRRQDGDARCGATASA